MISIVENIFEQLEPSVVESFLMKISPEIFAKQQALFIPSEWEDISMRDKESNQDLNKTEENKDENKN